MPCRRRFASGLLASFAFLCLASSASAQTVSEAVAAVEVRDAPNDRGDKIIATWPAVADEVDARERAKKIAKVDAAIARCEAEAEALNKRIQEAERRLAAIDVQQATGKTLQDELDAARKEMAEAAGAVEEAARLLTEQSRGFGETLAPLIAELGRLRTEQAAKAPVPTKEDLKVVDEALQRLLDAVKPVSDVGEKTGKEYAAAIEKWNAARARIKTGVTKAPPAALETERALLNRRIEAWKPALEAARKAAETASAPLKEQKKQLEKERGEVVAKLEGRTYAVRVSTSKDGPWLDAGSVKALEGFESDDTNTFGFWPSTEKRHFVSVDLLAAYAPEWKTRLDKLGESIQPVQAMIEAARTAGADTPGLKSIETELRRLQVGFDHAFKAERYAILSREYFVQMTVEGAGAVAPQTSAPLAARAYGNWFDGAKSNNLVLGGLFGGIILFFIARARKNPNLFLRKIPGLDAVDEAIGRATEMGKPLYYLTGRLGFSDNEKSISTVAATIVLSEVAEKIAKYDATLKVPHTDPIVCAVCQEITKEAFMRAGRPDSYRPDSNFFITNDQFSYTAAVNGMILRERPAAIMYFGYYYAESLLLAETGASTGAIQVAGTDAEHQLPFFFVACDYTLIGEELYAASAYLSREPVLVGSLRGQDLGKMLIGLLLVGSVIASSCGIDKIVKLFATP